jgi:hypothetical protein
MKPVDKLRAGFQLRLHPGGPRLCEPQRIPRTDRGFLRHEIGKLATAIPANLTPYVRYRIGNSAASFLPIGHRTYGMKLAN